MHFHAMPYQSRSGLDKARDLARILSEWQPNTRLFSVAFGDIQKQIVSKVPRRPRIVLYRRLMLRIAERLARKINAEALVTGDSLGQVASQTLPNLTAIEDACTIPVLRPLIGMDKEEITRYARRIETYETSILPDEDCCQLFTPKHPSTSMTVPMARGAEEALDIDALVATAFEAITREEITSKAGLDSPARYAGDPIQIRRT